MTQGLYNFEHNLQLPNLYLITKRRGVEWFCWREWTGCDKILPQYQFSTTVNLITVFSVRCQDCSLKVMNISKYLGKSRALKFMVWDLSLSHVNKCLFNWLWRNNCPRILDMTLIEFFCGYLDDFGSGTNRRDLKMVGLP